MISTRRMLTALGAFALAAGVATLFAPASSAHTPHHPRSHTSSTTSTFTPYETSAWWKMDNPNFSTPNSYEWPQTRVANVQPEAECQSAKYQFDKYWIDSQADADYLSTLKTLNSSADDARLHPHGYYALVVPGNPALCVQTVPVPAAPLPLPPTCDHAGSVVIPTNSGPYKWTAGPGPNDVTVHLIVGYQFPDGTRGPVTFTEDVLPRLTGDQCSTTSPPPSTTPPPPPSSTPPKSSPPASTTSITKPPTSSSVVATSSTPTPVAISTSTQPPLATTGFDSGRTTGLAALLLLGGAALLGLGMYKPRRNPRRTH